MSAKAKFVTKDPIILEGYQAALKPSKYGHKLGCLLPEEMIAELEEDRVESLKWAESKLKNPKRSVLKPEPWEEVEGGQYKVTFTWDENTVIPIVDTEGTAITDKNLPLFSGCLVKVAFRQKPYILKDGVTYGTSLKLQAIQVVSVGSSAGVDYGDLNEEDAAELFGNTKGFKTSEPNVIPAKEEEITEDDIPF